MKQRGREERGLKRVTEDVEGGDGVQESWRVVEDLHAQSRLTLHQAAAKKQWRREVCQRKKEGRELDKK